MIMSTHVLFIIWLKSGAIITSLRSLHLFVADQQPLLTYCSGDQHTVTLVDHI